MGTSSDFVLVIEDNPNHSELINKSIQNKTNYSIKSSSTIAEAIEISILEKPTLILSELQLSNSNVFDLIKKPEFRNLWPVTTGNLVPVVVLTSQGDEQIAVELMKNGIIDYIVKTTENIENIGKIINSSIRQWNQLIHQAETEKALQESEQRYRLIAENISDVIWTTDLNLQFTFVSPSVLKATGYDENELVGTYIFDIITPEYRDLAKGTAEGIFNTIKSNKTNSTEIIEIEIINKNKSLSYLEVTVQGLISATIDPIGIIGVSRDITPRRIARDTIKMFSQAIEQSPVSIVITDTKGNIEYVNPKFIEITGYTLEEVIGQNPRILKSGEKPTEEYTQLWQTITTGKSWRGEFHNKKKNGEFYWEQATISPVKNTKGEISHFLAVKEDITKIKEALTQLIQSEEKFRQLAENLSHVFWLYDVEIKQLLYISPAFEELWSLPTSLVYNDFGTYFINIISEDKEKVIKAHNNLIDHDELFAEEFRIVRPDGQMRWIWARSYPVTNSNGKTYRLAGIAEDITLRKQAEEDLRNAMQKAEESDKLKTAFLANISHEIRTPMNGIIGFTELMNRDEVSTEKRKHYADIIIKSTNQLLTVVNDILDLARIESNQLNIVKANINLSEVFNEVTLQFKPHLISKGIELIEIYDHSNEQIVLTDKTRIKQVIYNLVGNATKFTSKGKVKVGYRYNPNHVQCFVEDTGIGIPENKQHLIFGRFQQADYEHSRLYGGVGLGLAISKSLVEIMGGKMWFQSKEGIGSSFFFTIPTITNSEKENNTEDINTTTKLASDNEVITVLAAEDENLNFLLLEDLFENTNIKLLHAHDGAEAIEMSNTISDIRLILMDLKMPIINGIDATLKIKKARPNLPIIAVTAYYTEEDYQKAIASGCNDYIVKPFKIDNFFNIINKYIPIKSSLNEMM